MSSPQTPGIAGARSRSTVSLGRNLEKNLFAYATAASAALVSLAAPADAQIIYTPSNTPMAIPGLNQGPRLTQLDLNNDGNPDFSLRLSSFSHYLYRFKFFLRILPTQTGNEVVQGPQRGVAALPTGVKVGPEQQFAAAGYLFNFSSGVNGLHESGTWGQVEYAYVGVKFTIKGQFHYGWVRVKFPSTGKWELRQHLWVCLREHAEQADHYRADFRFESPSHDSTVAGSSRRACCWCVRSGFLAQVIRSAVGTESNDSGGPSREEPVLSSFTIRSSSGASGCPCVSWRSRGQSVRESDLQFQLAPFLSCCGPGIRQPGEPLRGHPRHPK